MSLSARGLSAGYRGAEAVRDVDLTVEPRRVAVLIGPNGSGKSTLLRCLARAHPPRQGSVRVDNEDLYRLSAHAAARRIAYVAQENPAPFAFTVSELVALGASIGVTGRPQQDRVEAALRLLDLNGLAGRSLLTLSGGERQRAALARAFAQETPYLLLDEPTAHLDLRHQIALLEAVRAVAAGGKGVLLILHDLNLAAAYADVLFLLHEGRLFASGTPGQTLTAETIRQVYQTNVFIEADPISGRPRVVPSGTPLPHTAQI